MKKLLMAFVLVAGSLSIAANAQITTNPVEYVKVCSLYGANFYYLPGTDICLNSTTGDAREQTTGGTWRSLLPYPEGKWTTNPQQECGSGQLVKVGTYKSTDFTLNAWDRKQTPPFPLDLKNGQFITKVIMSGGFFDSRIPNRHGVNGGDLTIPDGLCLRSIDPGLLENQGGGNFLNPPYGNGFLPIGCIANSRIAGMPASYSISATSAYPSIDAFFKTAAGSISGPYNYGKQLVLTTDLGPGGPFLLTTLWDSIAIPLAGTVTASVCVEQGTPNQ